MHLLLASITLELREKLLEQQTLPKTYVEMLPLLLRLEQGLKKAAYMQKMRN